MAELNFSPPQPAEPAAMDDPAKPTLPGNPSFFSACKMPWLCLMLGILVFCTFIPALYNDFVDYDDHAYVTENTHVQAGLTWEGIKWALGSSAAGNWHPLTWMSHMLDCQFYGLRPWGHHLTNVLLHTADTLLLFVLLRRMTGALWRSLLVAALFGLHPLHVQSVAWIAERKDVLSALFWMLTLWYYTIYTEQVKAQQPRAGLHYGLALVFFTLGLMSKSMLVTLPAVLLLLDFWPLGMWKYKSSGRLLVEKIPFLLLAMADSAVTFIAQKSEGAVSTIATLPLPFRLENAAVSYARYLGKLFWPENLAILYPYPRAWAAGLVLLAVLLLVSVSILAATLRRRFPFLLVGWFWFIGTLVPVIGLVQVGEQSMADRYMYLPMIGVLIAIIWGVHELAGRLRYANLVFSAVAIVVVIACLLDTRQQIGYWRNSETLFRHDVAVVGNTVTAHYKLAVALNEKGDIDGAFQEFQEVLNVEQDSPYALYGMGVILMNKGQLDEAALRFEGTIKKMPDFAKAHNELGVVLGRQGKLDEQIIQYQEALKLNPNWVDVHNSLGVAYARKGLFDDAINQFQAALALDPENVSSLFDLGLALSGQGKLEDAIALFQKVIKLKPDNADAHNNLGLALSREGKLDDAITQFQAALTINPNHVRARRNLDEALRIKESQPGPLP